jgi:hypothetical protein
MTPTSRPARAAESPLDAAARHTDMAIKDLQKMGPAGRPLLRTAMNLRQQILDAQLGETAEGGQP